MQLQKVAPYQRQVKQLCVANFIAKILTHRLEIYGAHGYTELQTWDRIISGLLGTLDYQYESRIASIYADADLANQAKLYLELLPKQRNFHHLKR